MVWLEKVYLYSFRSLFFHPLFFFSVFNYCGVCEGFLIYNMLQVYVYIVLFVKFAITMYVSNLLVIVFCIF